jgi:hypothetical protein
MIKSAATAMAMQTTHFMATFGNPEIVQNKFTFFSSASEPLHRNKLPFNFEHLFVGPFILL